MTTIPTTPTDHSRTQFPMPPVPDAVAELTRDWGIVANGKPDSVASCIGAVSTVVNALIRERTRYSVGLDASTATAATSVASKSVIITSAALTDAALTPDARIAVTIGMAFHEADHVRYGKAHINAVDRTYGKLPTADVAHQFANILEDVRIEARHSVDYPRYAGCFPLTLWWVAGRFPVGRIDRMPRSVAQAANLATAAVRYARYTSFGPSVTKEAAWWQSWARRWTRTDKPSDLLKGIDEAIAHCASLPVDTPPQPPTGCGQGQPGEGDGERKGEGQGKGTPQPRDPGSPHPFRPAAVTLAAPVAVCADCGKPESDPIHVTGEGRGHGAGNDEPEPDEGDEGEPGDGGERDGEPEGEGDEPGDEGGEDGSGDGDEPGEGEPEPGGNGGEGKPSDGEPDGKPHGKGTPGTRTGDEQPEEGSGEPPEDDTPPEEAEGGVWGGACTPSDTSARTPTEEATFDALDGTLPLHASDAITMRERSRDAYAASDIANRQAVVSADVVEVTLAGRTETIAVRDIPAGRAGSIVTDTAAERALRAAFVSRKHAHDDRAVARSGRVSPHRAYRVRAGFDTVFTRRETLSPDRLDVHLLLDLSGSMVSSRRYGPDTLDSAMIVAATITNALTPVRTVRVNVWGHSGTVWRAYDSRNPAHTLARIGGFRGCHHGGNNDGYAIATVDAVARKERAQRERGMIVVLSDGAPCDPDDVIHDAVESARRDGTAVLSVALANGLSDTQFRLYGIDSVVEWTGDWDSLARGLALIIGSLG